MPSRPVTPPWGKPVTELRTPNVKDGFATVLIQRDSAEYQAQYPIKRGTPYASILGADERVIAEFANNPLYFLKEIRPGSSSSADFGSSDLAVLWLFTNVELAESNYDFDRDYPGESTSVSRYIHKATVRRSADEATPSIAYGSTLTALISVNITAPGADYTYATGTVGNATCTFVCYGGQLILGIVTDEGSGITAGAAITITGDGAGATATARVQPVTAVLTHQEKRELPPDDPRSHDYVMVVRVYEILPGPWLPFTRYDDQLGPIQGQRRAVVNTGQVASLTSTLKTTYEARDGSSYVSWQIQEAFGAGVPGFDFYPIIYGASLTQNVRGRIVNEQSTIVAAGSNPSSNSLMISSVVRGMNAELATRTNISIGSLPPDEVTAYWDWITLPLCVLDIIHTIFCDGGALARVVTNYDEDAGASVLRKHRRTVSYVDTAPNTTPNLSGSAFEVASLQYQGVVIGISRNNVLNDAIVYDEDFTIVSGDDTCVFTEAYSFPATDPTATDFLAGAWYTKSLRVEEFGQSMWRLTKEEYYSAQGNPSIS